MKAQWELITIALMLRQHFIGDVLESMWNQWVWTANNSWMNCYQKFLAFAHISRGRSTSCCIWNSFHFRINNIVTDLLSRVCAWSSLYHLHFFFCRQNILLNWLEIKLSCFVHSLTKQYSLLSFSLDPMKEIAVIAIIIIVCYCCYCLEYIIDWIYHSVLQLCGVLFTWTAIRARFTGDAAQICHTTTLDSCSCGRPLWWSWKVKKCQYWISKFYMQASQMISLCTNNGLTKAEFLLRPLNNCLI